MPRSLLVFNPAAGQWWRRPPPGAVRDALRRRGWDADLRITRGQDHATELVREHLAAGTERVWVCGGDGTVGQAAAALVGSGVPIGILPTGTVNVVAAECGIPNHPFTAMSVLAGSHRWRPFRTWAVGARAALLGVGVGFDARVMGRVNPTVKDWLGLAGVSTQGVVEWVRYDFPALRVVGEDGEGRPFDMPATQLLATIPKRFAGRRVVAPPADPEDGLLDLLLFRGASRLRLAGFWLGVELPGAAHLRVPGVRTLRARRFRVAAEEGGEVAVHVNGDVVTATPIAVEPWGAVRLLVPEPPGDQPTASVRSRR